MSTLGYSDSTYNAILEGCRDGKLLIVAACLIEAGDARDVILTCNHYSTDGEVYTPFMIAVRNGHTQLVTLLLERFDIDVSAHLGTLKFDGYLIEGASPLWVASACGYFDIVKLLIEHNAPINQTTSTNSTPLRAACFHGKLEVVMYLLAHNADMKITNRYNNTCLMVSCYRGNLDVVEYLILKDIDVDTQANCGSTALHLACEQGKLDIVKALVNAGCDVTLRNKAGLTAAMVAADACHAEIIEFFTKQPQINIKTQVELLELLGASFANDKDSYNTEKTYQYLFLAMLLRSKEKLEKRVLAPIEAYSNHQECRTVRELQDIHHDQDAIHLEALIVRERILGHYCIEIIHPIVYRGAVYADSLQFNKCIKLWTRALHFRQLNDRSAHNDLLRFAEVFSQMLLIGEKIDVDDLVLVVSACMSEIKKTWAEKEKHTACIESIVCSIGVCSNCCDSSTPSDVRTHISSAWKRIETNMYTLLYLLCVVCKVSNDEDVLYRFGKIVYKFLKLGFHNRDGATLLHLAVNENTPVDDFHVKDICSFPNAEVTNFLLSCGADPNARNDEGNTPLHIIVQYEKPISDFLTLHRIISTLLEHRAHFDAGNKQRKSPIQLATTGVSEVILLTQGHATLKCLAARVIRNSDKHIPYKGRVPAFIEKFIDMH